jgi:hypothetical protein
MIEMFVNYAFAKLVSRLIFGIKVRIHWAVARCLITRRQFMVNQLVVQTGAIGAA